MKEVKITAWCDGVWVAHVEPVEAVVTDEPVIVDGRRINLDLCTVCHGSLRETQARWVEVGAPAKKVGRPVGSVGRRRVVTEDTPASYRTCPVCEDHPVSPTRSALGQHLNQRHDKKLTDFQWEYDPRAQAAVA